MEAVRQRVGYIQQFYQRSDPEIEKMVHHPYLYLTQAEMDHFVEASSQHLFRIIKHLWINGAPAEKIISAQDLSL
jgi:hypothetical protein